MLELSIALVLLIIAAAIALWAWWRLRGFSARPHHYHENFGGDYFRGLNYLLNEQPDKALEVFLQLAEVNPDTVETHLALGNLFRRRGEVEHAIRCHENIIAKDSISAAERHHAMLELAEDYRRAGLLDRAEDLYHQLAESEEGRSVALQRLLEIYQQEQDWAQATRMAERLIPLNPSEVHPLVAHFHCERAASALREGQFNEARQALAAAREHHPDSLRCQLLEAEILLGEASPRQAIELLTRSLQQQPELLPVALETLTAAYRADHATQELQQLLVDWLVQRQDVSAVIALAALHQQEGQVQMAQELLLEQLRLNPNVHLLRCLLNLVEANEYQQLSAQLRPIVEQLCDELLTGEVAFRCRQCGFGGHDHHWQCPSCKQWDSTWPVRGVIGK